MPNRKRTGDDTSVIDLPAPNEDRLNRVRLFLAHQAISATPPVSMLTMSVCQSGHVQLAGVGIERTHALSMLAQLDQVRAKLQRFVEQHPERPRANVVPLYG